MNISLNFVVEWDGAEHETLANLLEKKVEHVRPASNALASHFISLRKKSEISQVIALWMGYPGIPESLRNHPVFIAFLAATSLALISPRDFKIVPDSAGEVLKAFEMRGFHRVVSKRRLYELIDDARVVQDGVQFLLDKKLVAVDGDDYRLLETPLTNVKIKFV